MLPNLVQSAVELLVAPHILRHNSASVLTDRKGRDFNSALEIELGKHLMADAEELLLVSGAVELPLSQNPAENEALEAQPFKLTLATKFFDFCGPHHIRHTLLEQRSEALPDFVPLLKIGTVIPINLDYFRIGMEFFESKLISAMFGFAPSVSQGFLLECNHETLLLKISAESLKNKASLPLQRSGTFEALRQLLKQRCDFDLLNDYQGRAV